MAVVGWVLLALLGLIVLALFVPIRIQIEHTQSWKVSVRLFGAISVWSFPSEKKPKAEPEQAQTEPPPKATDDKREKKPSLLDELKAMFKEEGVSGVAAFFKKLVELLTTTLRSLARFITIRKLSLCIRAGKEEADQTALLYSQLCTATAAGLAVLSQAVRVKKPCVRVYPDFLSEKTDVRLRTVIWIWPFGVVAVGLKALVKFLLLLPKAKTSQLKQTASE